LSKREGRKAKELGHMTSGKNLFYSSSPSTNSIMHAKKIFLRKKESILPRKVAHTCNPSFRRCRLGG
jgi:hypothetical protein